MKKLSMMFLALLLFSACGYKSADSEAMSSDSPPSPSKEEQAVGLTSGTYDVTVGAASGSVQFSASAPAREKLVSSSMERIKVPEKIKRTADLNITVEDYKKARAAIEKIVKAGNAYIASENEQNNTYSLSNTMVIRVLNRQFDVMVNNVTGIAQQVNTKNIYTEDVTAEFVDITSRLKTKREVEKRYLEILKKANKITEILEVEEKIRVIQEEIEAKEGQLKYLNDQVDYSTINLSFHQNLEYTPSDEPGFFGRLGHAFGNGWKGFLAVIIAFVYAWPLWLILGVVAYFLVKFIRKHLRK